MSAASSVATKAFGWTTGVHPSPPQRDCYKARSKIHPGAKNVEAEDQRLSGSARMHRRSALSRLFIKLDAVRHALRDLCCAVSRLGVLDIPVRGKGSATGSATTGGHDRPLVEVSGRSIWRYSVAPSTREEPSATDPLPELSWQRRRHSHGSVLASDGPRPQSPPAGTSKWRARFLQQVNNACPRGPSQQTVIIFDWDDTLMPTTFLVSAKQQCDADKLLRCSNAARQLLEVACGLGHVCIVTNAKRGWVEHSARRWFPDLLPLLERTSVISARSRYGEQYPTEVGEWKLHTFLSFAEVLNPEAVTNLVSVGDALYEAEAALELGRVLEKSAVKVVKLFRSPTPSVLAGQLEALSSQFQRIVESGKSTQLSLQRR